jgi:hypothetical protein
LSQAVRVGAVAVTVTVRDHPPIVLPLRAVTMQKEVQVDPVSAVGSRGSILLDLGAAALLSGSGNYGFRATAP